MRVAFAFVVLVPSVAFAQPEEAIKAVQQKVGTLEYVASLEAPGGGFYASAPDPKVETKPVPSLRATSSAVRAWKYLDGTKLGKKFPNPDKHAAFVLSCYDPKTGAFAEPGGKPDVAITSVGVMAAMELGIPKEKFANAMVYIKDNAKTFEEVRIGAAAVEAWGVKDCPFKLDEWIKIGSGHLMTAFPDAEDGGSRDVGSVAAMMLRLDVPVGKQERGAVLNILAAGQRKDGGWGKKGEKASDIETTYRVMRALMLFKEQPHDVKKLRAFLDTYRNKDNGYATKPGDKSNMSGVYFNAIVSKWLDEMEAKK